MSKKTIMGVALMATLSHTSYADIINYGEPNFNNLAQSFANQNVHIVQLGDSHTAGDIMTETLRTRLQASMGDGGMGWAMPMYFSGQRMARFGYDNTDFSPVSSRTSEYESYTLGGLLAKPLWQGATLTLKAKRQESPQRILVSIRQMAGDGRFIATDARGQQFAIETPQKDGSWQMVAVNATLPLTLYNDNANRSAIGGWWAFGQQGRGAVVSAIGINGAELSFWNRWQDRAWQNELAMVRPQLLVLAYGTNEAHNNVSGATLKNELTKRIRQIRQVSPQTAILIMSAPESLKSTAGSCGTRPATLGDIQNAQREVAQNERTLYWDWQAMMGGRCSMKSWINAGRASKDGVHFSQSGYTELGNRFANDLLSLVSMPSTSPSATYDPNTTIYYGTPRTPTISAPTTPNQGYIRIERVN